LLNKMPATIWLMAALSYWTFLHRLYHTWCQIRDLENQETAGQKEKVKAKENQRLRLEHDPA
jgi:hypothetical protein